MIGTLSSSAFAQEGGAPDDYYLGGHLAAHLLLFQSATAPGPGGALVQTNTQAPLVQYVSLNALRLDTPFGVDTGEVELQLWGGVDLGDPGYEDRFQGDVQTATITVRSNSASRRAWVRLGRQIEAGGAARFARFDGASVGVAIVPELTLAVYGGLSVLPRWNQQPGYYHLGDAASSLIRDPQAFEQPVRKDYALVGGKMSYDDRYLHAALSVHGQQDDGAIGRRNMGLDIGVPLDEHGYVGASLLLDMDSWQLSTARLFADVALGKMWDLGAEYLKAEPALLMSHQSVLSVFGTSGYQEVGGTVEMRPVQLLRLTGSGYMQFYEESQPGARLGLGARWATSKRQDATIFSAGYARVEAAEVGYNSGRFVVRQPFPYDVTATVQGFAYFYDQEIEGYKSSLTGSLSVSYAFASQWELLWSSAASRSPYAAIDASTQLRLTYQFSLSSEGSRW
jgi:hypothetical protein